MLRVLQLHRLLQLAIVVGDVLLAVQIFSEGAVSVRHLEPRRSFHASRRHLLPNACLRKVMVCRQDSIEPVGERVALVELAVARHLALSVIQVAFHFCNTRTEIDLLISCQVAEF